MDTKNVIAAISLSAAIIILWGLFFAPPPPDPTKIKEENKSLQTTVTDAPSLDQNNEVIKISRNEALEEEERVYFENNNIKGSISLVGATIDDLTFKNYTETLNGSDDVVLLNPRKSEDGYYVETGWATTSKNIEIGRAHV